MRPSFRQTLQQSHIAGVAIAVLLVGSLQWLLLLFWNPLGRAMTILSAPGRIYDWPAFFNELGAHFGLQPTSVSLSEAALHFAAASLLSYYI